MKEIKIKVSNISNGPRLDIKAKNFDRIVKWGKRTHDEHDKEDA